MEQASLRNGNVHSADNWQNVLEPIIARYRSSDIPRFFRGDAGYTELYELLTHDGWFINIEHVTPATDMVTTLFENETIDALYQIELEKGKSRSRDEIAIEFNSRDDKTANILSPVETQCQWLRDIGFKDVDCYFKIYELAVFGGRRQD